MTLTLDDLLKIEKIVDEKFDEKVTSKLDEKLGKLPSKEFFAQRMDELTKEIKDARAEFSAHTSQHEDIHDQDDQNHRRFTRIEKHTGLPPFVE